MKKMISGTQGFQSYETTLDEAMMVDTHPYTFI